MAVQQFTAGYYIFDLLLSIFDSKKYRYLWFNKFFENISETKKL